MHDLLQLHQLPGLSVPSASQHDIALARQFFEANPQTHGPGPQFSPVHAAELARSKVFSNGRPDLNEAWTEQNIRAFSESSNAPGAWSTEFGISSQIPPQASPLHTNASGGAECM